MSVIYTQPLLPIGTLDAQLQSSTSMATLLQHLPTPYRPALGRLLQEYFRVSQKLSNAQSVLSAFKKHQTDGSYPQPVLQAVKEPPVQFSKEFLVHSTNSATKEAISEAVKESRDTFLEKLIDAKTAEVSALQTILAFDESGWKAECRKVLGDLCTTMGLSDSVVESVGKVVFSPSSPGELQVEFEKVYAKGRRWYLRALSLAYSAVERTVVQKMAKVTLKEKTDTAMTEAEVDKPVRSVVKEEIEAALSKFKKEQGKGKGLKTKPQNQNAKSKKFGQKGSQSLKTSQARVAKATKPKKKGQRK